MRVDQILLCLAQMSGREQDFHGRLRHRLVETVGIRNHRLNYGS